MSSEWREIRLGDGVQMKSGGTPRKSEGAYWGGSIPWLSAKDMKSFRIRDTEDHVTELGAANGTRRMPTGATFLLVRGMTLLNDIPIVVGTKPMAFNQDVKGLLPKAGVVGAYIPYLLLGIKPRLRDLVDLAGHGTGRLNTDRLNELPCLLPDEDEQQRIVDLMSSLDDRIDYNHSLAANLEAIARRLFKSWFVDFDPVRAKAAGEKPTGLADDIAALFPDRFVDSELGEIPEGWEATPLSAVVNLDTTSVKPFDEPETEWTHFSIPAFDEGRFPAFETGEQIASNKYLVQSGSVLVSKLNPTQWRCWRPPSELISKTSICSTEFMQFVVPENQREFLWGLCESGPLRDLVLTTVDGTTGSRQRAKPKDVMRGLFVMPGENLAYEYSSVVRPLLSRADACILEGRMLCQLRDLLLPRLISGKLRVSEVEETIAEAMTQ